MVETRKTRDVWLALLLVYGLAGCRTVFVNPNCAHSSDDEYAGYSVVLTIRDSLGRPAALGTMVELIGPVGDTVTVGRYPGEETIAVGRSDGEFTVVVTRPWWTSQSFESVQVARPRDHCASITPARRDVTLTLKPQAPAIRQVVPERAEIRLYADPPYSGSNLGGGVRLAAWVEADEGADDRVEWRAIDPEIAFVTAGGTLTARCRETPTETQVVARSVADPSVFAIVPVRIDRTTLFSCPPGS